MSRTYSTKDINTIEINTSEQEYSLDALKEGLGFLFNRYIEHQHKTIAQRIVKQLEMILAHPACTELSLDRCTFYRLLRGWRAKSL